MVAAMRSYAEAEFQHGGYPIFYELWSLDEALADEEACGEPDRDVFGDDFDAYLAGQLKRVGTIYAEGYVYGTAFSSRAPSGEFSGGIPLATLVSISQEEFEAARASGWLPGES